jgi:hypothetical protein
MATPYVRPTPKQLDAAIAALRAHKVTTAIRILRGTKRTRCLCTKDHLTTTTFYVDRMHDI